MDYQLSNREKSMQPKTSKFWCWKCDGAIINSTDKRCYNCKFIYNKKNTGQRLRYKKNEQFIA